MVGDAEVRAGEVIYDDSNEADQGLWVGKLMCLSI